MNFTPSTVAALVIAASFAAGLNVYATVLTLGVMARMDWVALPQGLEALGSWWVLGASGFLFAAEFVADKIPGFDLIWNAAHTFVRVPVAGLLAYRATAQLSPEMQMLATAGGAAIAMIAHGSKTAIRGVVTPSPEPVSNIALSSVEDVGAIGLTWMATQHPIVAASVTGILLVAAIVTARWAIRAVRRMFVRGREQMRGGWHGLMESGR